MRAKPIKVQVQKAWSYGQEFYYVFFKGDDGKSYRTCLSPICGNFKRWQPIIEKVRAGWEIWLDNLVTRKDKDGRLIVDADSLFTIVH